MVFFSKKFLRLEVRVATVFQKNLPFHFLSSLFTIRKNQAKIVPVFCFSMQKVYEMDSVWLGAWGCYFRVTNPP
jgi:hypothetical protein